MTAGHAEAMGVLIQADLDGELDAVEIADLGLHMAACEQCQALARELRTLQTVLRGGIERYRAPDRLRAAVMQQADAGRVVAPQIQRRWRWLARPTVPAFGGLLAGVALAAALAVTILPRPPSETARVAAEVATATERSQQPGHMLDMRSDHPSALAAWFHEQMNFAPPMRLPDGFRLAGGRLDYLHNRPVAVPCYRRGAGTVELYAWPEVHAPTPPQSRSSDGVAMEYWREGGVEYWAASHSPDVLAAFMEGWRNQT